MGTVWSGQWLSPPTQNFVRYLACSIPVYVTTKRKKCTALRDGRITMFTFVIRYYNRGPWRRSRSVVCKWRHSASRITHTWRQWTDRSIAIANRRHRDNLLSVCRQNSCKHWGLRNETRELCCRVADFVRGLQELWRMQGTDCGAVVTTET
jgi:hypothetical protein